MSQINLRRIDLNLLTIFEAVYEEGSQQKAAERLFLSQPAISAAISKFRHIVDDRLFVGTKFMRPTVKADEIYGQLKIALDIIREELYDKQAFDPRNTRRNFTIAISYGGGYLFGDTLYRELKAQAPHATLTIRGLDAEAEVSALLRQQSVDLVVSSGRYRDPLLNSEPCISYGIGVAVRAGHPRIRHDPSLEEMMAERYLWVPGWGQSLEEQSLIRAIEQRIDVEVPNVLVIPPLLVNSDLLALLPLHFAEQFSKVYGTRVFRPPVAELSDSVDFIWYGPYENDPELSWFRNLCFSAVASIRQKLSARGSSDVRDGLLD